MNHIAQDKIGGLTSAREFRCVMNWFVMTEKLDGFTSRSEDEFCGGKKKS